MRKNAGYHLQLYCDFLFLQNTKNFEVLVLDVNEPPVNITLNPSQPVITENSAIGSVVCTVEAYDSDFVTSLNLTLDIDAGGLFTISENQTCDDSTVDGAATKCTAELLLNGPINYEKASSLDVSIRASDRGHFISRYMLHFCSYSSDLICC